MGTVDQNDAPDGYVAVRACCRYDEHSCVGCAFSNDLVKCYQHCGYIEMMMGLDVK